MSSLFKDNNAKFSSVAAVCAIVGGNLGVGNVSGTAVAIRSGGPGFIVWMTLIVVITSIIKYATCYISIAERKVVNGRTFGGPAAYLQNAFGTKWAASSIAGLATAVCSITVGNLVQVNSLSVPMHLIGQPPYVAGTLVACALFLVSILGLNFIARSISALVPAMTVAYLTLCLIVICKSYDNILPSLGLIFSSCLKVDSFRNGTILAFVSEFLTVIQVGTLRGIFAADIGLGLEGTVHSLVSNETGYKGFAAQQSLISLISPFLVAVVTFMTTLVLLVTGVWSDPGLESTSMCFSAFVQTLGSGYIEYLLVGLMFCFSFTTVLTWLMCSKEAILFITRSELCGKLWTLIFIASAPVGALCTVRVLWDIADLSIALTSAINTVGILLMMPKYKDMFIVSHLQK
ncbi:MAG: alanine:cation symporter family protein [Anaplasma sp.]